jgi:hypothetical protein
VPELHEYLQGFPNAKLRHAKSGIFWMKERFGKRVDRPVVSINHTVFYRRPGVPPEVLVASKQLYATHYFEAAFGLTGVANNPEGLQPGLYLIHIRRVRLDVLREIPGFLAKALFKGTRELLQEQMATVKKNMEDGYKRCSGAN